MQPCRKDTQVPRARRQLWQHATAFAERAALRSMRDRIAVVALEDVVSAAAADATKTGLETTVIRELTEKYLLAAD
jgi:hypothetical protein